MAGDTELLALYQLRRYRAMRERYDGGRDN